MAITVPLEGRDSTSRDSSDKENQRDGNKRGFVRVNWLTGLWRLMRDLLRSRGWRLRKASGESQSGWSQGQEKIDVPTDAIDQMTPSCAFCLFRLSGA